MKIEKINSISKTSFQLEEYIPLKINFDTSFKEYHPGLEFVKSDSSLLELLFGEKSQQLYSITLVSCDKYEVLNTPLPLLDTIDGNIRLAENLPETLSHVETDTFETKIHSNGVIINLSVMPIYRFYKNNDIIWGIDKNDEISQLIVCMDSNSIAHLTNELQQQ